MEFGMTEPSSTQPILKAEGVTSSERYLARLCEKLFLSLWSYPSVFRDQGNSKDGDGKEVCDQLVVFQNHVLIFSDKSCAYPNTGVEGRDWCRWFRKSVFDSAKQVWGAERWLRDYPKRLYLNRTCTQPFPIGLPDSSELVFHRIVIARTATARCRAFFKGGSGSWIVDPSILGMAHYADEKTVEPFRIGDIDPSKGFIHVFDDIGVRSVMTELDTTADFVDYLTKREKFLRSGRFGGASGEEELLTYFLHQLDEHDEHDFVIPTDITAVWFLEGLWTDYIKSERRMRRIEADEVSYTWDRLIESFNRHILNGSSYNPDGVLPSDRGEPSACWRPSAVPPGDYWRSHYLNFCGTASHRSVLFGFIFLFGRAAHTMSFWHWRTFTADPKANTEESDANCSKRSAWS